MICIQFVFNLTCNLLIYIMRKIRKKITKSCKFCKKNYNTYTFSKQEFCSKKCNSYSKRIKKNCQVCSKQLFVVKSRVSRNNCENIYCSRKCYNMRFGQVKKLKRQTKYFDTLLNESSCKCGVTEKYLLTIHHIDGNIHNNSRSNHEVVCANCHIKRHLKRRKKDGEWVYHTKSLTPREILDFF